MKKILNVCLSLSLCFILFSPSIKAEETEKGSQFEIRKKVTITNNSNVPFSPSLHVGLANTKLQSYSQFLDDISDAPFTKINNDMELIGNRIGNLSLNEILPSQTKSYTYTYLTRNQSIDLNFNPEQFSSIPELDATNYIYAFPNKRIESDNHHIRYQSTLLKNEIEEPNRENLYYVTKKIFDYVQTEMHYTNDPQASGKGAFFSFLYKTGNEEDYAALMVALLRSQNIPSRTVSGYLLNEEANNLKPHTWVEVYFDNQTWIPFDPTVHSNNSESYVIKDTLNFDTELGKQNLVVTAYAPLATPDYSSFGKLSKGYVAESIDQFNEPAKLTNAQSNIDVKQSVSVHPTSTISYKKPVSIQISGGKVEYSEDTKNLQVKATYSNGSQETIPNEDVYWSSSNNAVATIENGTLKFTGTEGYVRITAYYRGLTALETTYAILPMLRDVTISPVIYQEEPLSLAVTGHYTNGTQKNIDPSLLTWRSTNEKIAKVDNKGTVTFTGKTGFAQIEFSYGRILNRQTIEFGDYQDYPNFIGVETPYPIRYSKDPIQLKLYGVILNQENQELPTDEIEWSYDGKEILSLDENGILTFTGTPGMAYIYAKFRNYYYAAPVYVYPEDLK